MNYVFVDFEMHPIPKELKEIREICRMEIIEYGAVLLNEKGEELSSFKAYVKPQYCPEITPRYEELTGITTAMVAEAEGFAAVLQKFLTWCSSEGEFIIYAWSNNDKNKFSAELQLKNIEIDDKMAKILDEWRDFQAEYTKMIGLSKPMNLGVALDILGEDFSGQVHDALWDARNTGALFKLSLDKPEFEKRRKALHIGSEEDSMSVSLGSLFDFSKLKLKD